MSEYNMSPGTILNEIQSLNMIIYTVVSDSLYISLYIYTVMNDIETNYLSLCTVALKCDLSICLHK